MKVEFYNLWPSAKTAEVEVPQLSEGMLCEGLARHLPGLSLECDLERREVYSRNRRVGSFRVLNDSAVTEPAQIIPFPRR